MTLRLLLVEDCEDDAILVRREIGRGGHELVWERVQDADGLNAALDGREWDVVVADYSLPAFSGIEALRIVRERGLDVPFILVSGTIDVETAVGAMRTGAQDYMMKDDLSRLLPAVERELRDAEVRRQRRAAQAALEESEERYRLLVDMLPEAVWVLDAGVIVFANDAAGRLFGAPSPSDLLGVMLEDRVHQDRIEDLGAYLALVADGINPGKLESCLIRHSGSSVEIEILAARFPPVGVLVVARDISERKQIDALKSDFVAMVSHELRTPLTSIDGYAQLLQSEHHQDRDSVRKLSGRVLEHTQRMIRLVEKLLDALQVDAETFRLTVRPTAPEHVVRLAVRELEVSSAHRLSIEPSEGLAPIRCDCALLSLAVHNLLSNAVKFSPAGGEVGLRVVQDDKTTSFIVTDQGVGIAPEDQLRIFERFVQGDMTSTREFGGVGLGLFIVRRVAEAHGGRVRVRSVKDEGSEFSLEVPMEGPGTWAAD